MPDGSATTAVVVMEAGMTDPGMTDPGMTDPGVRMMSRHQQGGEAEAIAARDPESEKRPRTEGEVESNISNQLKGRHPLRCPCPPMISNTLQAIATTMSAITG